MKKKNEQEDFWAGEFGDEYIKRNSLEKLLPSKKNFFSEIFKNLKEVSTCLELGANTGSNLLAIKEIRSEIKLKGLEINRSALNQLQSLAVCDETFNFSLLDFDRKNVAELVFTMGVLIHISPKDLDKAYNTLYSCSNKYILLCEYYNPVPIQLEYRGHNNKLFKRDFAGDMLDKYSDLRLINYGFKYSRDTEYPLDDITWFLLKKK